MEQDKYIISEHHFDKFKTYYLLALEAGKILPWELDLTTGVIRNIFGLTMVFREKVDTLDFTSWLEMIHPEDRDNFEPLINEVIRGIRDNLTYDYRIVTGESTASVRWLRFIAKVTEKDEHGKPLIIAGINQDIHDLKMSDIEKAEQAKKLRESEKKLKNAMKMGKISPWEYDFETGKMTTDRNMAEIWDMVEYYDRGNPIDPYLLEERIHADDRVLVKGLFEQSVNTGSGFDVQFRINPENTLKYMHFHCETVNDENGRPVKLSGLAQDITHLKKMEESLVKQFEGLKFISDQAGLGLWQMDIKTRQISRLNKQQNLFDPENEQTTFSFNELKRVTHPEDLSFLENRFEQLFNGSEERIEIEVRIKRKNAYRWIYIYGAVKLQEDRGPEFIEGLYQDVTEKKEIEGRLYQSQKMEAIGRLAGGVAHDFNNILQVIMGYSSLALMEIDSESEVFEYISNIVDSGEKAKNLVKQLLLFARKEKFRPGFVAPNEMVADLIRLFTRIMGDNISIEFKPEPALHNIYADSGQLEQVIMNLCINAKDAMTEGGKILVKTENIELGESWRSSDITIPRGSYVVITISDTGPGIPSEHISKIFEPFFTTKERHRGTGLGLAMVYSIIRHHGGYVDVTSIEGKGTSFRIYLPVIEGVEEIANEQKQEIYPRGIIGNATVLLAEDDGKIRDYTMKILTDAGYTVFDCSNGDEAVKLYKKMKENIDILAFDVMMPVKNGWDAYSEIAEINPQVPVVFFSGYDENILSPHFSDSENVKYIQKPFKYFVLINAVQELIDKRRLS